MSKEKQIEEINTVLLRMENCENYDEIECLHGDCNRCRAIQLYNAGYRKQSEGKWILTGTFKSIFPLPVANLHKACSVCRWSPPKYSDDYKEYKFCPNCGAKMKGEN